MSLMGDIITLRKKDGRSLAGIKASVGHDTIVFNETDPPLGVGDSLIRVLPGGVREEYVVLETVIRPHKIGGSTGRGRHYRARVKVATVAER